MEECLLGWRAELEQCLVELFQSGTGDSGDVILTVKGDTDLTAHLSANTRFLLRADTIFKHLPTSSTHPFPWFYPGLLSLPSDNRFTYQAIYGYEIQDSRTHRLVKDINEWGQYSEAQTAARSILKELNMPDVTHFELLALGERFTCERCPHKRHCTWNSIIHHYLCEHDNWKRQRDDPRIAAMRHPITYRNTHDLNLPERLVQLQEKVPSADKSVCREKEGCRLCSLALGIQLRCDLDDLAIHLLEVHDVVNPVEGLHYGCDDLDDQEWCAKWDAFYDAHGSVSV
ncbi:hypothetical protein FRC08_001998 [Ceratobasidium sp. 394]|nr:hypothetical protein FRC08_001998 [Ceratobasidium sp. 394]